MTMEVCEALARGVDHDDRGAEGGDPRLPGRAALGDAQALLQIDGAVKVILVLTDKD